MSSAEICSWPQSAAVACGTSGALQMHQSSIIFGPARSASPVRMAVVATDQMKRLSPCLAPWRAVTFNTFTQTDYMANNLLDLPTDKLDIWAGTEKRDELG